MLFRNRDKQKEADFELRIAAHRRLIAKVASTYALREEDQQDLSQEILLQLWKAYPNYDSALPFSTWSYRVALNTAISWYRRIGKRNEVTLDEFDSELIPTSWSEVQTVVQLQQLLRSLDEISRALLMMTIAEHSHAEIAEVLGISTAAVATRLNRLREKLKAENHF